MRSSNNRELWLAFIAIAAITLLYGFMVAMLGGIPPAREFFGHSLGIIGFILMLMTETLYTLRKRSRRAGWGRMSSWLDFHIFTGLVGPYLVLLHTSWKFNGLAGIVMLLTVVIVASGFIGRYIYTAVPRTAEGAEIEAAQLERQIAEVDGELQRLMAESPAETGSTAPARHPIARSRSRLILTDIGAENRRAALPVGMESGAQAAEQRCSRSFRPAREADPAQADSLPAGELHRRCSPAFGDVACGAHSHRNGAVHRCFHPHRRSDLLRHLAEIAYTIDVHNFG